MKNFIVAHLKSYICVSSNPSLYDLRFQKIIGQKEHSISVTRVATSGKVYSCSLIVGVKCENDVFLVNCTLPSSEAQTRTNTYISRSLQSIDHAIVTFFIVFLFLYTYLQLHEVGQSYLYVTVCIHNKCRKGYCRFILIFYGIYLEFYALRS